MSSPNGTKNQRMQRFLDCKKVWKKKKHENNSVNADSALSIALYSAMYSSHTLATLFKKSLLCLNHVWTVLSVLHLMYFSSGSSRSLKRNLQMFPPPPTAFLFLPLFAPLSCSVSPASRVSFLCAGGPAEGKYTEKRKAVPEFKCTGLKTQLVLAED